jgi:hypothetical protein
MSCKDCGRKLIEQEKNVGRCIFCQDAKCLADDFDKRTESPKEKNHNES